MTGARVALVTGATRGIGAAIAGRLAAEGWDLTLSARSPAPLTSLAEDLTTRYGRRVVAVPANMASQDDVAVLVDQQLSSHLRLDLLVLNAGMGAIGPLAEFPLSRFDKLVAINLRSAYQMLQRLLPSLRSTAAESPWGAKVVAISSLTGMVAEPLNSAYGATKAALTSLCETLSAEESAGGVSATALCPGYVATDMTAQLADVSHADMIPVSDVAELVMAVAALSRSVVIPTIPMTRPGRHLWRA